MAVVPLPPTLGAVAVEGLRVPIPLHRRNRRNRRNAAAYLGRAWSRQAVSTAEAGGREFTAVELMALAVVLDVPISWLFLPRADTETVEFPGGEAVGFVELADRVLIGGERGNAGQALVEEAMDIVNTLDRRRAQDEQLRKELDQRARGLIRAAQRLAKENRR
jgi:transcriptional regulator with XRE-family HTH domain